MAERDALGWARDILIVLILLAILAGIVVAILNMGKLFAGIGSFLQSGANNQSQNGNYNQYGNYTQNQGNQYNQGNNNQGNYSQNNYNQGNYSQNNNQNQTEQALSIIGVKLKSAVDQGDWSTAADIMGTIDSMSSQLPPEIQSLLPQLDEAVRNHDQAAFDRLYAEAQTSSQNTNNQNNNYNQSYDQDQNYNQNQNYNQTYNNNQPTSEWCIPGIYSGNSQNIPAQSTILGMTEHDNRQMCRVTYQASEQGMNIDGDCYIDDSQVCCAIAIQGQPSQPETCMTR